MKLGRWNKIVWQIVVHLWLTYLFLALSIGKYFLFKIFKEMSIVEGLIKIGVAKLWIETKNKNLNFYILKGFDG